MTKKTKIIYHYIVIIVCTIGCTNRGNTPETKTKSGIISNYFFKSTDNSSKHLPPKEYIEYCENPENNLRQYREIGDYVFSAFYQPQNYLAIKELKTLDSLNLKLLNSTIQEYSDLIYFSFKIQNKTEQNDLLKNNLKNEDEYYSRLEYFSFKMQKDFKLIDGNDTVDCNMYHYERVYGLAPYATFVVAFQKTNNNQSLKLWFHDEIFNNGIIVMNFERDAINNLPTLDI